MVAHAAWTDFGKGKGKGKSAPKGSSKGKYGVRNGSVPLEERKKRLEKLKKDTKCHDCGQSGHWAGDEQCPRGKLRPTANLAESDRVDYYDGGDYAGDEYGAKDIGELPCAFVVIASGLAEEPTCKPSVSTAGGDKKLSYGPYKGDSYASVAKAWADKEGPKYEYLLALTNTPATKLAIYQEELLQWLGIGGSTASTTTSPTIAEPVCKSTCKYKSTTGSNAYINVLKCIECGHAKKET